MDNVQESQESFDGLFDVLVKEVQKKNGVLVVDEIAKKEIFLMLQAVSEVSFEVMVSSLGLVIRREI